LLALLTLPGDQLLTSDVQDLAGLIGRLGHDVRVAV
jgi:hypothetical protein